MIDKNYYNKDAFTLFFNEYKDGNYQPRCLFIDLESSSIFVYHFKFFFKIVKKITFYVFNYFLVFINQIRNGPYR